MLRSLLILSAAARLLGSVSCASIFRRQITVAQSQPNPIASQYNNSLTGTFNGTISVLPIDFSLARSLVPSQYNILTSYEGLLPGFPQGMYPLVLEAGIGYDIRNSGMPIAGYSYDRIIFPFIDLLGDGYSTFQYIPKVLLAANNTPAATSAMAYGEEVDLVEFSPSSEAYAYADPPHEPGQIYFNSQPFHAGGVFTTFWPSTGGAQGLYPLAFYQNVTNQPIFGNGSSCDNQVRFFNTVITTQAYTPVGLEGNVTIYAPYVPTTTTFSNVQGIKLDTAFVENNPQPCVNLKGYTYQGQ